MAGRLFRVFSPLLFQGINGQSPYFEVWHFNHVVIENVKHRALSIIAGIVRAPRGKAAFVQMAYAPTCETRLFMFPYSEFSYSDDPFEFRVGRNTFSLRGVHLDLKDDEGSINGDLRYQEKLRAPAIFSAAGLSAFYGVIPFAGCRHGIGSMRHEISGSIGIGDNAIAFDEGHGNIEKYWGRTMPKSWVCIQSTEFPPVYGSASLSFTIARILHFRSWITVFECVFTANGREYRVSSAYRGGRIELLETRRTSLRVLLRDRAYKMEIQVREFGRHRRLEPFPASWLAETGPLDDPAERTLSEKMNCRLRVVLKRRRGSTEDIVVDASTIVAAAEIAGNVSELTP